MVNFVAEDSVASKGGGLGFAKKQLQKHGWTEGKGLGKDESGRPSAIKVGVKNNTFGVGFDSGKEYGNHWWDHLFNKAASNIVVENSKGEVQLSKKDPERSKSKKVWRVKEKELYFGRFVKASNEEETTESNCDKPVISTNISDEELFRACGGRTAHKSARHGHKLSGKLKRIAEQDDLTQFHENRKVKKKKCSRVHSDASDNFREATLGVPGDVASACDSKDDILERNQREYDEKGQYLACSEGTVPENEKSTFKTEESQDETTKTRARKLKKQKKRKTEKKKKRRKLNRDKN